MSIAPLIRPVTARGTAPVQEYRGAVDGNQPEAIISHVTGLRSKQNNNQACTAGIRLRHALGLKQILGRADAAGSGAYATSDVLYTHLLGIISTERIRSMNHDNRTI